VESLFELEWALCLTHHGAGSTNDLICSPEIVVSHQAGFLSN
jgi:hypothetical protein